MNRRNFLRSVATASAVVATAPVLAKEASTFTPTWDGYSAMLPPGWSAYPGAQRAFMFGHGRGGKSLYGEQLLSFWMQHGKIDSTFCKFEGNKQIVWRKRSATTFEMTVTEL